MRWTLPELPFSPTGAILGHDSARGRVYYILRMGAQSLRGRRPNMGQFRGSVVLTTLVLLTGLAVMVLMCWVLFSGHRWLWELW
jgi:hypothetical protein